MFRAMRTSFLILAFSQVFCTSGLASPRETNKTSSVEYGHELEMLGEFLLKRIPNFREVVLDVVLLSVLDTALQEWIVDFKKDPANGAVLRDAMKIFPTLKKVAEEINVGGTDDFYSRDHVWSQLTKIMSKLYLIKALLDNGYSTAVAGKKANYASDSLSRAIIVAGKDWKRTDRKISFEWYFVSNFSPSWLGQGTIEAGPKVAVMSFLSYYIVKRTSIYDKVRSVAFRVANGIFPLMRQNYKKPFYRNTQARWDDIESQRSRGLYSGPVQVLLAQAFGLGVPLCTSIASFVVFNVGATYLLAPPARIIQDGMDALKNKIKKVLFGDDAKKQE